MKSSSNLPQVPNASLAEEFSVEEVGGCTVVTVRTDLDIATAGTFTELVGKAAASGKPIVVDMTRCAYSDSTGLRAIAVAHATFPDGSAIVVAPTGTVRRLFAITGFEVALAPFATLAEALRNAEAAGDSSAYG